MMPTGESRFDPHLSEIEALVREAVNNNVGLSSSFASAISSNKPESRAPGSQFCESLIKDIEAELKSAETAIRHLVAKEIKEQRAKAHDSLGGVELDSEETIAKELLTEADGQPTRCFYPPNKRKVSISVREGKLLAKYMDVLPEGAEG